MTRTRRLALILTTNTAGGAIPAVFFALFGRHTSIHRILNFFAHSSVYSYCIGTMVFVSMDFLLPRFRLMPLLYRVPVIGLFLVALAIAGSVVATGIQVLLGLVATDEFVAELRYGTGVAIAITLMIGTAVTAYLALTERLAAATLEIRTRQLEEERARKLATEARLSSLESRLHPHFLFNTLNSISAQIRERPAAAEQTVERLASLLRYSLDLHNGQRLVPLRRELEIVEDYLEIERTRFGSRLRAEVRVPPEAAEVAVPPMAVQTLVENSIKYAVAPQRQGGEILVTAKLEARRLRLEVSDDGPGFDPGALENGHGLDNLRERLSALFGSEGSLEFARRDGRTLVTVVVPQSKVPQ